MVKKGDLVGNPWKESRERRSGSWWRYSMSKLVPQCGKESLGRETVIISAMSVTDCMDSFARIQ